MCTRSSSLHMTSHILRQKLLQEIHDRMIRLINEGCYPLILEIFGEYKKSIKRQSEINDELHQIRLAYQKLSKSNISIDELRAIITNELQALGINDMDHSFILPTITTSEVPQLANTRVEENFSYLSSNVSFNGVSSTMQKAIEQAQNNTNMLNEMISLLRQQRNSLPIN